MANDLNQCNFIGLLGKDPESRALPSGDTVTNFSIAVGESWKDKQTGEKKERTTWVSISCFGKLAEIVAAYAKSGTQVRVSGKLQVRQFEKDGEKRYSTEIQASEVQLLGGNPNENTQRQGQQTGQRTQPQQPQGRTSKPSDDVPF